MVIAAVFIVALGLVIYSGFSPDYDSGEFSAGNGEASLIVNFGNEKRMFVGEVIDGMTAMDALDASSRGDIFSDFIYTIDGKNKAIASIDGFSNDGKNWTAYVNGVREDGSLDEIILHDGDKIELKFE